MRKLLKNKAIKNKILLKMECCVGVSTKIVLQIDMFYTVVKIVFKLTPVSDCSSSSAFTPTKDYSPKCQFKNSFHYGVELIYL